ncbi:MAG: DNA polymerase III subunit gamma/tau, partial [Clostridia bacterium]|nr:DNA polymerase III subunit gamma/tau [Clostridia bacterium]
MHQALYRKWRPKSFDEVYGQDHITSILKYEIDNKKFSHAYLFCGSRGTGKTTCAKILAKAVNCLEPINGSPCGRCEACLSIESGAATDVIEMDAASNNGVDNIRDIRDEVVYSPSNLKYRVYIIDEVHMLSASAFNALLKTLEEPPEHVVFILATTELHKLPATIISRCQRFDFRRITTEVLKNHLLRIAKQEGIEITE